MPAGLAVILGELAHVTVALATAMPARPATVAAAMRLIHLLPGLAGTATLFSIGEQLMQRPWMVHGAR